MLSEQESTQLRMLLSAARVERSEPVTSVAPVTCAHQLRDATQGKAVPRDNGARRVYATATSSPRQVKVACKPASRVMRPT